MNFSAADNLLFLREQYPDIYRLISNREVDRDKFVSQQSRNGWPNLGIADESGKVRSLYSKYDPELECIRWAESQQSVLEGAEDVLLLGVGLGYHALALLALYPEKRFFLYEPDIELFRAAVETVDLRPLLNSKQVCMLAVGSDESIKSDMLLQIYKYRLGNLAVAVTPPMLSGNTDELKQWVKLLPQAARHYSIDVDTITYHRKVWIENALQNLPKNLLTPTCYPLDGAFPEVPAIIVGSGPSLELEAERLRALQDRVLIIAAGTAAAGMQHLGIQPHLIITIDPGEPNRRAFEKVDLKDTPLLYVTTVKHEVVRVEEAPYMMHGYLNSDVLSRYLMNLRRENGIILSTATVTGTAVQFAVHLGCKEITFIGQDFSYPLDKAYASGVEHVNVENQKKNVSAADMETPNVSGGMNRTNSSLLNLKEDVERLLTAFPFITFYNASPVGAVIEGTKIRSLAELLELNKDRRVTLDDFKQAMRQRLKLYPPETKTDLIKRARKMLHETVEMQKKLEQLKHVSEDVKVSDKAWLEQFEEQWKEIVESELYEKVLALLMSREKDHAERYWPQMFETTDYKLKKERLLFCVQPLVLSLTDLLPFLQVQLEKMLSKLEGE